MICVALGTVSYSHIHCDSTGDCAHHFSFKAGPLSVDREDSWKAMQNVVI
jgi:hypothetical protein